MNKLLRTFSASLIAGLILIILLGYLFLFQWSGNKKTETAKKLFPEMQKRQINSIRLKYSGREVTLIRDGSKWLVIKDSKRFNADGDVVGSLLNGVSELEIDKVAADSPSSLDDFGLNTPRVRVMLKTAHDEYKLSVGSETPVRSGTYIKIGEEQRVLIVDKNSLLPFLDRSESDFRDKQILALDDHKVKRVVFGSGELSIQVEREHGRWVAKDMPDYVQLDQDRISFILKAFFNLKIDNFEVDDPKNLSAYGLVRPNAEIDIFQGDNPIRVLLGNRKKNGDYYIKLDSARPVYSVSENVFARIPESIDDIRARKITDIDPAKVRGLEIEEGDNHLSMNKIGDKWRVMSDGKVGVNETKIKDLLNGIASLEVETFVEDNPRSLAPYGLERPETQITVTTSDDEKVTLLFGKKEEKKVYTKISGQGSIYKISDVILSKIHVFENEFQE
jgi:hypothetical protein